MWQPSIEYTPLTFISIVQLLFNIIEAGLIGNVVIESVPKTQFVDMTVLGYLIISFVFVIGYVISAKINPRLRAIFVLIGFIIWLISCAILFEVGVRLNNPRALAGGSFALFMTLSFIPDFFFCYKESKDEF